MYTRLIYGVTTCQYGPSYKFHNCWYIQYSRQIQDWRMLKILDGEWINNFPSFQRPSFLRCCKTICLKIISYILQIKLILSSFQCYGNTSLSDYYSICDHAHAWTIWGGWWALYGSNQIIPWLPGPLWPQILQWVHSHQNRTQRASLVT